MTQAAIHANRPVLPDAGHEIALAAHLREAHAPEELAVILDRFSQGSGTFDAMMRRVLWRALLRKVGNGARIGRGVRLLHPETLELGDNVFIGDDAVLQGHAKGSCTIGSRTWIGPQAYLDARALHIGEAVGIGPGARVLCSEHSGEPVEEPVIATALEIGPVHVEDGSDIGMNAVVLPGVRIGKGSVVGAGSVVTRDVPPGAVVAGAPAKVMRMRGETKERSP